MTPLYVHYQATRGVEPYLLSLEAEVGTNHFSCLVRPSVTVSVPTGMAEQDIIRFGLSPRMVIPWLAQMARTTKTVVLYDRDHFLRVIDCEIKRMGATRHRVCRPQVKGRPFVPSRDPGRTTARPKP